MKLLSRILFLAFAAATLTAEVPAPDARDQIAALRSEIARHDQLYHQKATPEISDADYDQLKRRLAALERSFPREAKNASVSPAEIGDDRSGLFHTYRHRERMRSLDKVYAESELRSFHARMVKTTGHAELDYIVEPKFDGLAVSVTFERGKLVRAVTRGNGVEGDDITANVLQIRGLRHELIDVPSRVWPEVIEIRGEIHVPFAEFQRVNAEREGAGESRFANPRNLAAGTMRQLDPREVSRRGLRVVFFGVGACEPMATLPTTQQSFHGLLAAWGLPVIPVTWSARGADELVQAIELLNRARGDFEFPTDGAVVKLDSFRLQREVGVTDTAPRWALAYKFAPQRVETQVRAITLQVGRTGVLTPVAELVPVQLAGSMVARATLHNRDEITRKDIRVGDTVSVEKAGDIIPAVIAVNVDRRPASTQPFVFPRACPECNGAVISSAAEVAVRCTNQSCPAQLRRRIEHFASKACVDIEGLGPTTVEGIVANGWVTDLPDLYRLRREDLLTLARNNEKSVDRLLAAIETSKHAELWRVIHGLGIPQVGAATAKELARQCRNLNAVAESGPKIAAILAESRYQTLIANLIAAGVAPESPTMPAVPVRLTGKTFVLTGTLASLTRAQATAKIEAAGAKVGNSVTRTTDYLVVGAEAGAKLTQARALGVAILNEAALLRMLAGE
jgi:DNA ligase (NAD+)